MSLLYPKFLDHAVALQNLNVQVAISSVVSPNASSWHHPQLVVGGINLPQTSLAPGESISLQIPITKTEFWQRTSYHTFWCIVNGVAQFDMPPYPSSVNYSGYRVMDVVATFATMDLQIIS